MVSSISRPVVRSNSAPAAPIKKERVVSAPQCQYGHDKWGSGYMKGKAPSESALRCEANFKDLTALSKEFKSPGFLKYDSKYFWNKVEGSKFKDQYGFMINRIQEGMSMSHPDVNLHEASLLEVFDFVLGADHTLLYKTSYSKEPVLLGFDVTKNPNAVEVKIQKTHCAYRGSKLELLKEFGFQGYIVILWSVKDYENHDKKKLLNQLLEGLKRWNPKDFTHAIEIN